MSPPVITISTTTPETVNASIPSIQSNKSTKPKIDNTQILNSELYKNGKLIPQEKIQDTALKITQKLAKLNFRDTGFLANATNEERNNIIAHAMYYQLGRYDPSNQFVKNYGHTRII